MYILYSTFTSGFTRSSCRTGSRDRVLVGSELVLFHQYPRYTQAFDYNTEA